MPATLRSAGVSKASALIRGRAGSNVAILIRKPTGQTVRCLVRRSAVPGGSTEILGSLFGSSGSSSSPQVKTMQGAINQLSNHPRTPHPRVGGAQSTCSSELPRRLSCTLAPTSGTAR